jgi:hypothetical protein
MPVAEVVEVPVVPVVPVVQVAPVEVPLVQVLLVEIPVVPVPVDERVGGPVAASGSDVRPVVDPVAAGQLGRVVDDCARGDADAAGRTRSDSAGTGEHPAGSGRSRRGAAEGGGRSGAGPARPSGAQPVTEARPTGCATSPTGGRSEVRGRAAVARTAGQAEGVPRARAGHVELGRRTVAPRSPHVHLSRRAVDRTVRGRVERACRGGAAPVRAVRRCRRARGAAAGRCARSARCTGLPATPRVGAGVDDRRGADVVVFVVERERVPRPGLGSGVGNAASGRSGGGTAGRPRSRVPRRGPTGSRAAAGRLPEPVGRGLFPAGNGRHTRARRNGPEPARAAGGRGSASARPTARGRNRPQRPGAADRRHRTDRPGRGGRSGSASGSLSVRGSPSAVRRRPRRRLVAESDRAGGTALPGPPARVGDRLGRSVAASGRGLRPGGRRGGSAVRRRSQVAGGCGLRPGVARHGLAQHRPVRGGGRAQVGAHVLRRRRGAETDGGPGRRGRSFRAVTTPSPAAATRGATVLGEELGNGSLPRVVDLGPHPLHRAS